MTCRRHGTKPTLALWMLVAVADVALLAAAAGVRTVLLVLGCLAIAAAGATVVWSWSLRRSAAAQAAPLTMRRRA